MATIRKNPGWKRPDGRRVPGTGWQIRYRDSSGRQRSETYATKADAQARLAVISVDLQRGTWVDPAHGRTPFEDWVGEWWRTSTGLAANTRARDASVLRNHVLPAFTGRPLVGITQLDVRAWVADLAASGLAPNSVHKAYQILSKVMGAAVDAGLLAISPCRSIRLPKVDSAEMRCLAPAEVARLAATIDPRYRALVLVGAYGGLRIGELAGLRRSRVDVLRRHLDVSEQAVEVGGTLTFTTTKTRAGRRRVPLPRPVVAELERHMAEYTAPEADALVFPGRDGGALRARAWRARYWMPAVEAAGLAPLTPHGLRHSAVSRWIADGASPKQCAVWGGHSSVRTILDIYGHLFPGHEADVLARAEAVYVDPDEGGATILDIGR